MIRGSMVNESKAREERNHRARKLKNLLVNDRRRNETREVGKVGEGGRRKRTSTRIAARPVGIESESNPESLREGARCST